MVVAEFLQASEFERRLDGFAMVRLDGLHHPRHFRRVEIEALALGNRDGTRVGATHHDNRQADPIEPGDVGNAGNTHDRHQGADSGERRGGGDEAVGTQPIGLGRVLRAEGVEHGCSWLDRDLGHGRVTLFPILEA